MTHDRPLQLSSAPLSDIGSKRKNNEDSILHLPQYGVFGVADGMGGADAGEVASAKAVQAVEDALLAAGVGPGGSAAAKGRIVSQALKDAGEWIWKNAIRHGMRSCGTTAVIIAFDSTRCDTALIVHAGDSRAYRFRGGMLEQLTRDHSLAAASGVRDARELPARLQNVITRAVGIAQQVVLDETPVDVQNHDLFLLCSDGLSSMVRDQRIQEILRKHAGDGPDRIAQVLVRAANEAGGNDNISVVVIRADDRDEGVGEDRPTSAGRETCAMPSETAAMPRTMATMPGMNPAANQPPLTGPSMRGGLSLRVRVGLGLVAILLLVLALISIRDRRSRAEAGTGPSGAVNVETQQDDVTGAIPSVYSDDSVSAQPQVEQEMNGTGGPSADSSRSGESGTSLAPESVDE